MKLLRPFALVIGCLLLSGCDTVPTAEQIAAADYGSYPTNYEQIVKSYLSQRLIDPESVRYREITVPRKYWSSYAPGYRLCVTYNAKNRMGGYTGFSTDLYVIHNGRIVDKWVQDDPDSPYPHSAELAQACG